MDNIDYEDLLIELKSIVAIKMKIGGAFRGTEEDIELLLKTYLILDEKMLDLINEALGESSEE